MRFGVLGPLTVHDDDGSPVVVGAPKVRALLAVLLLEPNRPVSTDGVMTALWGERPPATATASLHNHLARLRKALGPHADRLRSRREGVELRVGAGELDLDDFDGLTRLARRATAEEDWEAVCREAGAALALWRGLPLADVPGTAGHPATARLLEQRLDLLDSRSEALLRLGRLDGLPAELRALVAEHPFRESFSRRLMLVLSRTGRQAEALAVFRSLRRTLVEELGVEPGPAVQDAHREVLRSAEGRRPGPPRPVRPGPPPEPPLAVAPLPPPVAQLPSAPAVFVGREAQTARVRTALGADRTQAALVVISGMAGVGKTGLALHLAASLREDFPDGQLYLNLHGGTPGVAPLQPAEAVAQLLLGLGTDARRIPEDPAAATALLRSRLAATRTLLVLDDAAGVSQVLPLLPAGAGCVVLLTSRTTLATLDAAVDVPLDPLSDADGALLLARASGRAWADSDGAAVARIVALCGRLPLALRVSAARLRSRRTLTVGNLAERLARPEERLDHLELEDLSVRRSLRAAHDGLRRPGDLPDEEAAAALALVGALDLPEYPAPLVAWTMDLPERNAERALERLAEVALLQETARGPYVPHDLVRAYARELADQPHRKARTADTVARALRWYVEGATLCSALLRPTFWPATGPAATRPPFTDAAAALAWADAESENLLFLASGGAERHGLDAATNLELVNGLFPYLQDRGRIHDLKRLTRHAVTVARASGDAAAEGRALFQLATAHYSGGHLRPGVDLFRQAVDLSLRLGDDTARMLHLGNLAVLLKILGRPDEARSTLSECLSLRPDDPSPNHEAILLGHQGHIAELADPREALGYHRRSAQVAHEAGIPVLRQMALCNLGHLHLRLGEPIEALDRFQDALEAMPAGSGHWNAEREVRLGRVKALLSLGLPEQAEQECAQLLEEITARGDTYARGLLAFERGHVRMALADEAGARTLWREALAALEGTDAEVLGELRTLVRGPADRPAAHRSAPRGR
ncbi:BTAD domain-containing putative transcriptional regulator [Streptomyces sp. W1SF4]|uniref:AfsR/SARP family transcriptional regulator n=1 Tax=Streptomyces sp. W1SF4 TaxID=2305220 RepID=UPI000F6B835A|nr:BTAD domain-containing putative transcriptional regulator [Streptomyces sp. W1SF4]AZM93576.1 hypothetical protein D1J60_34020 [Streptomyces sp. W1SF4]